MTALFFKLKLERMGAYEKEKAYELEKCDPDLCNDAAIVPRIINARLYRMVLRVIIHASEEANKYLKLSNPTQSLLKIPLFQSIFLKAITRPNIGA